VVLAMSDDEYVEGDSSSEPATAPGEVPTDDAAPRDAKQGGFDSTAVSDAPVIRRSTKTQHTVEARKAFAKAVLENKSKPAAPSTGAAAELADLDPETAPIAASDDAAKAKAAGTMAPPPKAADILAATPPPAAPPAPSLDPEVRRLKEQLAAERQALAAERAEFEKSRQPPPADVLPDASNLEDYIDHAPRAFRTWLESMRGEKFATDDEFKAEMSDFITQASADVLGVPLPDATRTKLEAALARKAVRTSKVIQTKREAALQAKLEKERKEAEERAANEEVERQWTNAAHVVGQQFAPTQDATGKATASQAAAAYPWLAAEDEPGKIVVDVIRAAMNKDGTQMSWQEASKKANDFLAQQYKTAYERRKPLLGEKPAAPVVTPAAKPAPAETRAPDAAPLPEARVERAPQKWTRDKHVESTKAAFRKMISGQG
jgi:hypothetical protein